MAKILLDYVFPIAVVATVPEASTAFLKQACVVAKPKTGQEGNVGNIYECTTMAQVAVRTDNTDAQQLFAAGMSRVFILLADDLDMTVPLAGSGDFWTLLISSDFDDADATSVKASIKKGDITFTAKLYGSDGNAITVAMLDTGTAGAEEVTVVGTAISISAESTVSTATQIAAAIAASEQASALITTAIDPGDEAVAQTAFALDNLENGAGLEVGGFDGVVGFASADVDFAAAFAAQENHVGFFKDDANGNKSMFYAFGKLLSNTASWKNQQYISMPVNDGVDTLGAANALFDVKVSFVINDSEFGNRLALFAAGGKAIVAPYIGKNLRLDLQSKHLSWVAANQPDYTLTEAALLEQRLQEDIINLRYIDTKLISAGVIEVKLLQSNFTASGFIDIAEPKALWRMVGEMSSTL